VVFLLLLGHGWLNMIEKKSLLEQYHSLGFSDTANIANIVGALEILAAASILYKTIAFRVTYIFYMENVQ
jgi:hypothetical protein